MVSRRALSSPYRYSSGPRTPPGDADVPTRVLDLLDGGPHPLDLTGEGALHAEDHEVGLDGPGRDQGALDDQVGVAPEDGAILERAGFTLGGVDDDRRVGLGQPVLGDGLPLPPHRETGAAPPPQPGGQHTFDDGVGFHLQGRGQPFPSSPGHVVLERDDGVRVQHPVYERHDLTIPRIVNVFTFTILFTSRLSG